MDRASAISAIDHSLSQGSGTPIPSGVSPEAYLTEQAAALLAAVIEPVAVTISSEMFNHGTRAALSAAPVFAIAHRDSNWLLFSPELGVFSLAFGPSHDDLGILGFSSNDALAEWLG